MNTPLLQSVILSGGSGTRLWPLSREQHPKQLLALTGTLTMLQATALRSQNAADHTFATQSIVVCNDEYRFTTAEQLRVVDCATPRILLEPVGRNTAPALTLAALLAQRDGSDPLLLVMPADHVILNEAGFSSAVAKATPFAVSGAMVTFGVVPDRAETGYGYIQLGWASGDAYSIAGFFEKPDLAAAQGYLLSGDFLWNSGLFMMRASVWIKAIAFFQPVMLEACQRAIDGGTQESDFYRVDAAAFEACPSESIDFAVMEKLGSTPQLQIPGYVIPLNVGWSDVGAWDALWHVSAKDSEGNAVRGNVLMQDAKNNLVFGQDRLVACAGIEDLIVVDTPDALLVAKKDKMQRIKHLVSRLKQAGRTEVSSHRKVHRPWGWYDTIDSGERFQVKRIVVNPGSMISLQMHHHRAEHWIVVKGTARITRGDEIFLLAENESTYIPLGKIHRLENPGKFHLEMIEVQSGSYLGEDDIVRFEDTYGRN